LIFQILECKLHLRLDRKPLVQLFAALQTAALSLSGIWLQAIFLRRAI